MIGVTGYEGRLGQKLVELGCIPLRGLDVTDPASIIRVTRKINCETIIHCAAITEVDKCEDISSNLAVEVNGTGTRNLRMNYLGRIIYLSTDYVFDGLRGPYTENAKPNPISNYGYSKLIGEAWTRQNGHKTDVTIRTTILYGTKGKEDFVTKVVSQLSEGKEISVPFNLYGNPTYTKHLAEALVYICNLKVDLPKIINVAGKDVLSRYEFALMIADVFGLDKKLISPIKEVPGEAMRPLKAGLKLQIAEKLGIPLYSVLEGLKDMKGEIK
jgi:dTDP-4-dehydrorhamnose reductase